MVLGFTITIILELVGTFLILHGLVHEKELIEWEERQKRTIRLKWKKHKAINKIRMRRFKRLIWEEFTRKLFEEEAF